MGRQDEQVDGSTLRFSAFLRAHKHELLARWEAQVRAMPIARGLSGPALLDHIPQLFEHIVELLDTLALGGTPELPRWTAESHALQRLDEGFDLSQVVAEYAALRACILDLLEKAQVPAGEMAGLVLLNRAIDQAIAASVEHFMAARDRTLQALDRISAATLESGSVDELLQRLLRVLIDTTRSVDTAAIFLREGDRLRIRAAVGFEEEVSLGFSLAIGEGFAGRIAQQRRPLSLGAGDVHSVVKSQILKRTGVRSLYGIPLLDRGEVIGVAHIGSATAYEFSEQDQRLLLAMAHRVTASITQHLLRATAERRAAELEAVIQSIPDAVYIGDSTGIKHTNALGLEQLGYAGREELDRAISQLVAEIQTRKADTGEPISAEDQVFSRALRGETATGEVVVRHRKTGEDRVLRSAAAPIRLDGEIVGAVTVNTDITEQKRAEQELRRLYEEAQRAIRSREDILAIVSHDLKNPLGAIGMSASLLLKKLSGPEVEPRIRKQAETIRRATDRMEHLIRDLLDMASIQAGRLSVDKAPHELAPLLQESIELHEPLAREKGLALHKALDVEGVRVACDRERVLQVLSNLLGNAIKFCRPGEAITVRAERQGSHVQLAVVDSGPGISEEELPRIFEPYWSGQRHASKGTGLGLFISRGIVEAHGGRMWVESKPGMGSAFYFTLPLA